MCSHSVHWPAVDGAGGGGTTAGAALVRVRLYSISSRTFIAICMCQFAP